MKLKRLLLPAFAAGLVVLMAAGLPGRLATTEAANSTIEVTLLGEAENPAVKGDAGASARFVFNDVTRQLDYAVTISGLSADLVTASHIHRGAPGVNGPIIHTLSATGFTQASGSVTLSEADVADLRAGNLYVNVHSKDNPGGYARGQMYLNVAAGAEATVLGAVAAWNNGDPKTFLSYWTDTGIFDAFDGATRAEALAQVGEFMAQSPVSFRALSNVQARGTAVTGILEIASGISLERTLESFTLENGVWKISGEKPLLVDIPSDVTPVDMKLQEFSFVYDRAQLASGARPVAFRTTNVGKQEHEIVLVKINRSDSLLDILASSGPESVPAGIQPLAEEGPIKPGESKNVVLLAPLAAGRYAFLCFLPDTDGTPHALKGMISEFNVGSGGGSAAGGASIRPPSTGDAGLKASQVSLMMLAGIALLTLSGGGALVAVARRS